MNNNLPAWQIAVIIVIVVAVVAFFGIRWMNGGPNADVTQQNLAHWRAAQQGAGAYPGAAANKGAGH